ncbi:hypothetical protein [Desulfosarcina ovata]|uniref:hypothetical protein n=1 Tax=Desulfosarcina ovata TaxID=83564 RepID=UPI0012D2A76A|nr:hypothetical protein [Desulfosarcina ovata]
MAGLLVHEKSIGPRACPARSWRRPGYFAGEHFGNAQFAIPKGFAAVWQDLFCTKSTLTTALFLNNL